MPHMPTTTFGPDRHRARQGADPAPPTDSATTGAAPRSPAQQPHVDARGGRSVSLPPSDETNAPDHTRPASSPRGGHKGHALVAVGPGLPEPVLFGVAGDRFRMNALPITPAKIHRPLLRSDVLSRQRLNSWLDEAVAGRLALLIAEAGFGKTTLLADWSRHARRLTAWYRLESDDRDWLTFIRHLVGSGRELDPDFAPETYALLLDLGPGGPTQANLVASLVGELVEFGTAHPQGLTLILDDYHAIDRSEETEPIVRAILDRTGPGFSVIIASRSAPRLPLGRLRARGGVSRLDGEALCFDIPEAERLFRDAYHRPLEPDVVTELIGRTEGWPALLSLVRTNLEDSESRDPRSLVHDLSGAHGDMYDYLAEEVIDRLPAEQAEFLTKASLLDVVDVESAQVITGGSEQDVAGWLRFAEELRLLSQPDVTSGYRLVPLVREFLTARLRASTSASGLRDMHLAIAHQFEASRWRVAATHFERAGENDRAVAVIERSLDQILGAGQYRAAADLLAAGTSDGVVLEVLRSRLSLQIGATNEALAAAKAAVTAAEGRADEHLSQALLNAVSVAIGVRHFDEAQVFAERARTVSGSGPDHDLAEALLDVIGASVDTNLPAVTMRLEGLLASQLKHKQWHYAAITSLNLAQFLVWLDRTDDALRAAADADLYFGRSSRGYEAVTVRLIQAQAKAIGGRWTDAAQLLAAALDTNHPEARLEAVLEAASIAAWYGPYDLPVRILARVRRDMLPPAWALHWRVLDLWLETSSDRRKEILAALPDEPTRSVEAGAAFRWHLTLARAHWLSGDQPRFLEALERAEDAASAQGSPVQERLVALMGSLDRGGDATSNLLASWPKGDLAMLGVFAQELSGTLDGSTTWALEVLARAAAVQPHRWLDPLRAQLDDDSSAGAQRAATLLEGIGEPSDILRLRQFSRKSKRAGRTWGDQLIARLAPRVLIEDLGFMSISVGDRVIQGSDVRRKVLALLAFLACQPKGSATPDQILDALWPDLDPEQGTNSLHQTIYFLRRVIDPSYRAGFSAEYLHFDTEIVWLDPTLVDCRSWRCRRLLAQRPESQELVEMVLDIYPGKFAADFAYEDWAAPYREMLHAGFLGLIERTVSGAVGPADLRWRLWIGQRALAVDPEADEVEAQIIRLYRALGAPAAAAEQYAHYSTYLRDQLGVEPPSLDEV